MPLAIDFRMEYDPLAMTNSPKLLGMGLNGVLRIAGRQRRPAAGAGRHYAQTTQTGGVVQANNYIQQSTRLPHPGKARSAAWCTFNYDIARSTLLNQRYVGYYNAQCCGVAFEYQAFNYPEQRASFLCPRTGASTCRSRWPASASFSNFFGAFGGGTMLDT